MKKNLFFTRESKIERKLKQPTDKFLLCGRREHPIYALYRLANFVNFQEDFVRMVTEEGQEEENGVMQFVNFRSFESNEALAASVFFPSAEFHQILPACNRSRDSYYWRVLKEDVDKYAECNTTRKLALYFQERVEPTIKVLEEDLESPAAKALLEENKEHFQFINKVLIEQIKGEGKYSEVIANRFIHTFELFYDELNRSLRKDVKQLSMAY